jgi:hypothetical protein
MYGVDGNTEKEGGFGRWGEVDIRGGLVNFSGSINRSGGSGLNY